MSQNVLVSQNYVIKLILKKLLDHVGIFMMWWSDNDFWVRVELGLVIILWDKALTCMNDFV